MKRDAVRSSPELERLRRRFRGIHISNRALQRVAQIEREVSAILAGRYAAEIAKQAVAAPPTPDERVANYNAGYTRAIADLTAVDDCDGFRIFIISGRRVIPGPDGRLRLEQPQ